MEVIYTIKEFSLPACVCMDGLSIAGVVIADANLCLQTREIEMSNILER